MIEELEFSTNVSDANVHQLTDEQQQKLDFVTNFIPSFNKLGLGRTSIHEFKINTGMQNHRIKNFIQSHL